MSKQKTAFVFTGLSDREGQTERDDPSGAAEEEQGENSLLDSEAASSYNHQHSAWAGRAARYKARRWLEGGTFWQSWRNATHGASRGKLMKQSREHQPLKHEVRTVSSHL